MSGFKLLPTPLESLVVFVCMLMSVGNLLSHQHGSGVNKVFVKEHDDAVLPCSLSTRENLVGMLFDWRKNGQKDGQKEVFLYDAGNHYNNGRQGQDKQFKGRVSHFQGQLMNGNASIKIQNAKMADSGIYSCDFPKLQPGQTFSIELVVELTLKDRSGEIPGTCPEPYIKTLNDTKDGLLLLQCEVRGASLEPKIRWQDSAGNILPSEEKVSERGGLYYVTLKTAVTKTDHYRCVVTQEDIGHQIDAETFVPFYEKLCEDRSVGWLFGGTVIGAAVLAVVLALLVATKCITVTCNQGPRHLGADYKPPAETESNSSV
ncbi:butyrophilin subfamily 2 member A2-like isoform X1 [Sparus aurata]|uniref:butyrophilin subfamily 2 member A2-like isoform X1 n=1 Tax=Sparus aurata TaxID=8175 RepID=UPI0011C13E4C|nr:butyrophilin subfamily 2 member A2-like isoform X1 [Sparus aurata]